METENINAEFVTPEMAFYYKYNQRYNLCTGVSETENSMCFTYEFSKDMIVDLEDEEIFKKIKNSITG